MLDISIEEYNQKVAFLEKFLGIKHNIKYWALSLCIQKILLEFKMWEK